MHSATFFFYFSIPEYETQAISAPPFPLFRHTQREPSYHEKQTLFLYTHLQSSFTCADGIVVSSLV